MYGWPLPSGAAWKHREPWKHPYAGGGFYPAAPPTSGTIASDARAHAGLYEDLREPKGWRCHFGAECVQTSDR